MNKAIVKNNKVINILQYSEETGIKGLHLPLDQSVFDSSNFNIVVGDDCVNGIFMRNGEVIPPINPNAPTEEEMTEALEVLGVTVNE